MNILWKLPVWLMVFMLCAGLARSGDIEEIRSRGVLRHLGVPYANFVTGDGGGLSVELMQLFAAYLGVRYEFVETTWGAVIDDLTGKEITTDGRQARIIGELPRRGDLIANGLTILPWRKQVIDFSIPVFPTQVWLITGARSSLVPITPSGTVEEDIQQVKEMIRGKRLAGLYNTCLDPRLYGLEKYAAGIDSFTGNLNELTPAVIRGDLETALLDVPDSLVALTRWPGAFKIIGPVSEPQEMGVGFRKDTPELRAAFNDFFQDIRASGTYDALVRKYYPDVFNYYPEFF